MGLGIGFDVGSMLGGIGSAGISAKAARDMQKRQIEWERERATSAHQWEVEDLKKAGLNPILSAGGSGATTGGISAPLPDMSGLETAGSAFKVKTEMDKNKAETQTQKATVENIIEDTNLKIEEQAKTSAETAVKLAEEKLITKKQATEASEQALKYAQTQKIDTETKVMMSKLEFEIGVLKEQIKLAEAEKNYKEKETLVKELERKYYTVNMIMQNLERGSKTLQNSAQAVKNVSDFIPINKAIGFLAKQ